MKELRRLREERGMSLQRLADASGVNKVSIIHIEQGRQSPKLDTLEKLAVALDVEVADLLPKAQSALFPPDAEQRRALACVRSWLAALEYYSERLEELASSGKFDRGKYDAAEPELTGLMTGLNTMLSELRSWGIDPNTGLIGEELDKALLRLSWAQHAADAAAAQVLSEDELAQRRERKSVDYEGKPEEVVRSIAGQ